MVSGGIGRRFQVSPPAGDADEGIENAIPCGLTKLDPPGDLGRFFPLVSPNHLKSILARMIKCDIKTYHQIDHQPVSVFSQLTTVDKEYKE